MFVECTCAGDLLVIDARRLQDALGLQQQIVLALEARPREKDDPGYIAGMRGNQGRDHSAFAVADEADFLLVKFLARFQVSEGRFGVAGKIFGRRICIISRGLADSTFIEAQNGDAFSREMVCQH